MTAYLIVYGADPTDRFAAYSYPTRAAAQRASLPGSRLVPRVPPGAAAGGCAYVVETEADVAFGGNLLIGVVNGLTAARGVVVKKFETRGVGVRRLLAALAEHAILGVDTPTQDDTTTHDDYHLKDTDVTKKEEKAAAVQARKAEREAKKAAADQEAIAKKAERDATRAAKGAEKATAKPVREPKPLGEFKQIRPSINIGRIATAVLESDKTVAEIAASVTMTSDEVIAQLKKARVSHGVDYEIGEDGIVSLIIPDGVALFSAAKPEKTPRQPKPLGEFQQVRPSTNLGKIATAVIEGKPLADIAATVTMTEDEVKAHLKRARVTHGIDHTIGEGSVVSLTIPEGVTLFKEPAAIPEKVGNGSATPKVTITEDATIRLLVLKNPKRPTAAAYARFELYREGQTVAEFLAAGGTKADLSWDRAHNFIAF